MMMKIKTRLGQYFLINQKIVQELVAAASINKSDVVLEIGAGRGTITKEIAKRADKVLAIEIDKSFKSDLDRMPSNVKIIYEDALKVLEKKIKFNKIIGNLSSFLVEPLSQRLIHLRFDLAAFLIPLKFVRDLTTGEVFPIYLQTRLIRRVDKKAFSPPPKTNWALVRISPRPNSLLAKDYERFIQQYLHEHQKAKLKNALREAVIRIYESQGKKVTKDQAHEIVKKTAIPPLELEDLSPTVNLAEISRCLAVVL